MTKTGWVINITLFICSMISVFLFSLLFKAEYGFFWHWSIYLIVPVIFVVETILRYIASYRAKIKFYSMLQRNHFIIQKQYIWQNRILCIDFENKKFACNLFSIRPIIFFKDVRSCSIELSRRKSKKTILSLVISVKMQGGSFDFFHITMFDKMIFLSDDTEKIDFDKTVKDLSNLEELISLRDDIEKIVEINRQDGLEMPVPTKEEMDEYLKSTTPNRRFWEK